MGAELGDELRKNSSFKNLSNDRSIFNTLSKIQNKDPKG